MSFRKAYQTLEDRGNYDYIENNGPFICNHKNAWLGIGYYFWDSFIDNAHWWGIEGACYKKGYIICESTFELDENKCFNLVDNPNHLNQFNQVKDLLLQKQIATANKTTVRRIVDFIKNEAKIFNFEAIRSYPINSINQNSKFSKRTSFNIKEKSFQYLDSTPAIQICFYNKSSLNRKGFKIVFPVEYSDDYLV